jgi:autotransporter-associated beta strand protein
LLFVRRWPFVLGLILTGSVALYGQDDIWQGPSGGSWFTSTDWSLGAPPAITQTAIIDNATTVQVADGVGYANNLLIGQTAAGSTLDMLLGGILHVTNQVVVGTGGIILFDGGTLYTPAIEDNGKIEFLGAFNQVSGVPVSGSGELIMDLTGTHLLVSSNNTYSGQTILMGGTMVAETTTALSPNSAFIVNSTLDLNGFNNTIGSLSGSGIVANNGTAAATLTVGNDNNSTTFSGVLEDGTSDTGTLALVKIGTGTLTLTGLNTYTGTTTVDGGSLFVNGAIASPLTVVNPGASLGGTGLIGGNLVNNGIVSPGNPVGTLTISGNYTQNASGTLRINVAGAAPGQYGVLSVGGHATLAGGLQLVALNGFKLQVGDRLTFLTAAGGVSGSFSTVVNPFISTLLKIQLNVLADSVQLVAAQGNFVSAACNPNSASVAANLNSAASDPRAAALISYLDSQPVQNLCADFTKIAPEQITAVYNMGVSTAGIQSTNIMRRMDDIHNGSTGFSSAGFSMNGNPPTYSDGLSGPSGGEGKAGPSPLSPVPENRWGIFVTGLGEFTHVDGTEGAAGFDLQSGGVTFGADYRVCSHFAVGLTGGYAHINADVVNGGNIDVNSGKVGAYATIFGSGFYLDTAVNGSFDGYDSHRSALLGTAQGSTDGNELTVLAAVGYDWTRGGLTISPIANFQYTYVSLNGFTETGSLAPLKYPDQSVDSTTTAFGLKSSYDWRIGNVLIKPELSLAWQHEYSETAYSVISSLANGAGGTFSVTGPRVGRDSLLLGAGVAVLWSDRISTYVYYDGDLARTNYVSNNITGGVRITF